MTINYTKPPTGARPTDGAPLIVNFGGGVDSTAMLIGLVQRGIRPDLIMFADTGSERPETYDHVAAFSAWLVGQGFPAVTTVHRYGALGQYGERSRTSSTGDGYTSLEGNCLQNETPPSEAFGRGSCSSKWKHEPMDKWLATNPILLAARAAGLVPVKAIGLDCGPADIKRKVVTDDAGNVVIGVAAAPAVHADGFLGWYPLREWEWTRDDCIAVIKAAGLPVPVKSSCFFCPNMTEAELRDLAINHPDHLRRAVAIEDASRKGRHGLRSIEGLWRRTRKADSRPGSWRVWAEREGFLEELDPTVHEHVARVQSKRAGKAAAAKADKTLNPYADAA